VCVGEVWEGSFGEELDLLFSVVVVSAVFVLRVFH